MLSFLNQIFLIKSWLRSSAWLEHWTFNPGVGGSNPLGAIYLIEQSEIRFSFDKILNSRRQGVGEHLCFFNNFIFI